MNYKELHRRAAEQEETERAKVRMRDIESGKFPKPQWATDLGVCHLDVGSMFGLCHLPDVWYDKKGRPVENRFESVQFPQITRGADWRSVRAYLVPGTLKAEIPPEHQALTLSSGGPEQIFRTKNLHWVDCPNCLVAIDRGQEAGALEFEKIKTNRMRVSKADLKLLTELAKSDKIGP